MVIMLMICGFSFQTAQDRLQDITAADSTSAASINEYLLSVNNTLYKLEDTIKTGDTDSALNMIYLVEAKSDDMIWYGDNKTGYSMQTAAVVAKLLRDKLND